MSENQNAPNQGTPIEGEASSNSQNPGQQLSNIELKAMDMGWRPKEEWEGEPEDFIEAGEFVRRKPLFDKIESASKEVKNTRKTLEAFKEHYQKVRETEYARAIADLKAQAKEARAEGEHGLAEDIVERREAIEAERDAFLEEQKALKVEETGLNPAFERWVTRNNWYQNQPHMRVFADNIGNQFHAQGMTLDKVLVEVEKAVRKEFPTKFRNPNRDNAPSVEGPSIKKEGKGGSLDDSFMSEQDRQFMARFVRDGVLTKEEYIRDMKIQYGVK
jgi:hypothetical protein